MKILHHVNELASELSDTFLISTNRIIISIDGFSGAGKGHLCQALEKRIDVPILHCDDYFQKDEKFLNTFRFDRFRDDFKSVHLNSSIIIEGMLVADILAKVNIHSDVKIYVKRMSQYGFWHDDQKINHPNDYFGKELLNAVQVEYHFRVKPHESADYVIELIEGNT